MPVTHMDQVLELALQPASEKPPRSKRSGRKKDKEVSEDASENIPAANEADNDPMAE